MCCVNWMNQASIISCLMAVYGCLIQFSVEGHVVKREVSCPVYYDTVWKARDSQCLQGEKYHCFDNGYSVLDTQGCFEEKICIKGAHPVVEGNYIVCDLCRTGYQPEERLNSSTFTQTYCLPHSRPCRPEFGESLCRPGTREWDRACTCNASLGFSSRTSGEHCDCFTPNDACSGCVFNGCPEGSVKNDRGFCEPDTTIPSTTQASILSIAETSTRPSTTTSAAADDDGMATLIIAVVVISVICVGTGIVLWRSGVLKKCCKKGKRQVYDEKEDQDDLKDKDTQVPLVPLETLNGPGVAEKYIYAQSLTIQSAHPIIKIGAVKNMGAGFSNSEENVHAHSGPSEAARPPSEHEGQSARTPSAASSAGPPGSESSPLPSTVLELPSSPTVLPATDLVDPSAVPSPVPDPLVPPSSLSDLSASHPSLPTPSAPPPSLPTPSAPPPSLPTPSAPPPSLPTPSAPPPSLPTPSAPPPSLPIPSAPPLSLPEVDQSEFLEEERSDDDDEKLKKTPLTENDSNNIEDDDETLRKEPPFSENGEMNVKTALLSQEMKATSKTHSPGSGETAALLADVRSSLLQPTEDGDFDLRRNIAV